LVLEADEFQQVRINQKVLVDRDGPWSRMGLWVVDVTSISKVP